MNKENLSAKWSKYCDTDSLVDSVMELLKQYHHRNSEHGVCTLLDAYFTNKEPLIRMFATSPHYIGDMRISVTKMFERQPNRIEIYDFFMLNSLLFNPEKLYEFVDEDGKRMTDYLNTGKTAMSVFDLTTSKANEKMNNFNWINGSTSKSNTRAKAFREYLIRFQDTPFSKVQKTYQYMSDKDAPVIAAGTKTSRAFNKVCVHYGFDKVNGYNKAFAQYADLVSDLAREMNFIISLNPLDYLTMSFGVSWESCHNIRAGGWKGGCLSYMLDNTSIITFVVNGIEGPIHKIPKVYRQMFHYDEDMFVQSRLYPQGNDGAVNLYDKFRGFVTEEFSSLLNVSDEWDTKEETYNTESHINSEGSHYRDYGYNRNCRTFYHRTKVNKVNGHKMTIGRTSICANCGRPLNEKNMLSHSSCVVPANSRNEIEIATNVPTFTITIDDWA